MGKKVVHVKIGHIVDSQKCNYMKFYDKIKTVIGDDYELSMTDINTSINPGSVDELIELFVDDDSDKQMTQLVLSIKCRFESIKAKGGDNGSSIINS